MSRTILIVEDEADIRLIMRINLEDQGFQIWEAGSAEEALELILTQRPDAVLIDLRMPGMGGKALVDRLKGNPHTKNLPLAIISAHASPTTIEWAAKQGCTEYVTKPFTANRLLEVVEKLFVQRSST